MLVLRPIFGISTTHIPSGSTLNFCSAVGIFVYCWIWWFLDQYLALGPRTFPVDTHEVSEVLWAYLCSVGYAGANANIWN